MGMVSSFHCSRCGRLHPSTIHRHDENDVAPSVTDCLLDDLDEYFAETYPSPYRMVSTITKDYVNSFYHALPSLENMLSTNTLSAYPIYLVSTMWIQAEWFRVEAARRDIQIDIPRPTRSNPVEIPFTILQDPRAKRWAHYNVKASLLKLRMEHRMQMIENIRARSESLLNAPIVIRSLRISSGGDIILNDVEIEIVNALYALEEGRLVYRAASDKTGPPVNLQEASAYLVSAMKRCPYPLYYHPASDTAIIEVLDEHVRDTGRGIAVDLQNKRVLAEVKLYSKDPHSKRKNPDPLQAEWFTANTGTRGNNKCFYIGDDPHVFNLREIMLQ